MNKNDKSRELPSEILAAVIQATGNAVAGSDPDTIVDRVESVGSAMLDLARNGMNGGAVQSAVRRRAVSIEESLASDDHIRSMIDGKPYKVLKRHIRGHGMTAEEYLLKFDLPPNYPLVSKNYSKKRSRMARKGGLGKVDK